MTIKQELKKFTLEYAPIYLKLPVLLLGYLLLFVSAAAILISVNKVFGTIVPVDFWTTLSVVILIDFVESIADRIGGNSEYSE